MTTVTHQYLNYKRILQVINERLQMNLNEIHLYIIKAHLVVENEMISFIEHHCNRKVDFGWSMLKRVLIDMYDGFNVPAIAAKKDVEGFIRALNDLRNQTAHSMDYKPQTMKEAISFANKISRVDKKITTAEVDMFNSAITTVALILALGTGKTVYAGDHPELVAKRKELRKKAIEKKNAEAGIKKAARNDDAATKKK